MSPEPVHLLQGLPLAALVLLFVPKGQSQRVPATPPR